MTPTSIIQQATADGVTLLLTPSGTIRAAGNCEAIERWRAILAEHKPSIVTVLRDAANNPATHCRWSITYLNLPTMEVAFTPEATAAEVRVLYPGAGVSPLPAPPRRTSTTTEAAELRVLIERVLSATPDEWDECHRIACADPDAALICWRTLAAARQPSESGTGSGPDDRRTCRQCRNLASNGLCMAAARGELLDHPARRYTPAPDVPRRCEGFAPTASDSDQRTGRDCWPSPGA